MKDKEKLVHTDKTKEQRTDKRHENGNIYSFYGAWLFISPGRENIC